MLERFTNSSPLRLHPLILGVGLVVLLFLLWPQIGQAQGSVVMTGIERFLWGFVNAFFGWMVWFGGMLLDLAINNYVIGFGTMYTGSSGLGFTIDRLWVIVRDIFNLTFIFGLVYIGLRMIFDSSDSSTQRMLKNLILAALLINFSLFITKFVIDFSNIAAAQFATAFQNSGTDQANVSGAFMNVMGLTSIWSTGADVDFSQMQGGGGIGYIFGTMILYIIAAFVFLGGALLLMIRFVVLNIYMVLSPLMFLGWVFPSMASTSSKYWQGFMGRAFFAPAYLLMLYFAHQVLTNFSVTAPGGSGLADIFGKAAPSSFPEVVPPFVLTSVFLIAALVVAQKMGANGADGVMSVGKMMTGKAKQYAKQKAGSATFGTAAAVGRTTIGQAASRFSQSERLNRWAAKDRFFGGKLLMGATKKVADSSFDARKVAGLGAAAGIGTGRKGGYATIVKERTKADAEFAKSLKEGDIKKDENGKYTNQETAETVARHVNESPKFQEALTKTKQATAEKQKAETAATTKRAEVTAETARLEAEIAEAETKSNIPTFKATAERKKQELADYKAKANTELNGLDAITKQANEAVGKADKLQEKIFKELTDQAEAMVKYANQLAFIDTREQQANWRSRTWNRAIGSGLGAAAGGGGSYLAGAGLAGGTAAFGGASILGFSVLAAGTDIRNQSVEALRKSYGKDGTSMIKAKKKKEQAELVTEVIKENTEPKDKPEKKDEDKDSE